MNNLINPFDNPSFKMIVLTGPSCGVGKTTIVEAIIARNPTFVKTVTCTTRKPSKDETHGVDYFFLTKEEFLEKVANNEFIETNDLADSGNLYGLTFLELRNCVRKGNVPIHVCDVRGGLALKQKYPDQIKSVFVFAPLDELETRIKKRGRDNPEEIQVRLALARKELHQRRKFDVPIANKAGMLEKAKDAFEEIIKAFVETQNHSV
jgi:guanylate kinase